MYVQEHNIEQQNHVNIAWFHSFTFTGKERDEETGYGYFGARYMDHELMTMWLSVDPMADKVYADLMNKTKAKAVKKLPIITTLK